MLLKVENVSAGYGDLKVLFDLSLEVDKGEVVALVGSNGAGKTTLLRIISGFEPVTSGSISFDGKDLFAYLPPKRAGLGIAHIPQGRGILGQLTVKENLLLGAFTKRKKSNVSSVEKNLTWAYDTFPILKARNNQPAGSLSGGEQQMLAISRALMMEPKLIIMDEPSLGLAPIIVEEVFGIIKNMSKSGVSILLIEQNLVQALSAASRGYVLETGRIVMHGPSETLLNNPAVRSAYLGI